MLLRDDIDHTRNGIRAVERARCALHDLYLLDVVGIDEREVVLTAIVTMQPSAVDEDEHIRIA